MLFGKHVNKYYLKYAPVLLLGILALLLVDYFQLEIPELYKMVINGVNDGYVTVDGVKRDFDLAFLLDEICLPMIFIIVALVVGRFLWRICFFGTSIRVETDLRRRMFDKCKTLSEEFYQNNKVGGLMSLYTNDLETIQECFGHGILMLFDAGLLGVLALVKMFEMNVTLTVLSLIPMAMLLGVSTVMSIYLKKKWADRQKAYSELSHFAQESFSGIAVIKAFAKEFRELWAFKRVNKKNENANVTYTVASTLLHIFVTLFVESVICIILGYGGYLVYVDAWGAGELIEFMSYFDTIVWPIMAISQLIEMTSRGKASYGRVAELLEEECKVTDREGAHPVSNIRGDIEFRHLTFRHPGSRYDALTDISFTVRAGESVGIIGKTGAGKTTLADLILRTYNVPDGTLFIDGHDVNAITIRSVREACAYVPQDNFLFSDTIGANIAFATDEPVAEDVTRVAILADVHDNITEFHDGYHTVLGERGVTVSGGQKQRISIARALLKDAPILILDDSVSAVDTDTERIILENLRKTREGKTTLLIAHRVSTVCEMDKILFLDDGELIAVGTHAQLLESCPEYRRTVELQRLEDEEK